MDVTEYTEICDFLLLEKYPESVNDKNLKRNFRRKASKYYANEERILHQVSTILRPNYIVHFEPHLVAFLLN